MSILFQTGFTLVFLWATFFLTSPDQVFATTSGEMILFAARQYVPIGASHFQMSQAYPDGTGKKQLRWPSAVPLFAFPSPDGSRYVYAPAWANTVSIGVLIYYQPEGRAEFLNGTDPKDSTLSVVGSDGRRRRRLLARAPRDLVWINSGEKLLLFETGELLDVNTGNLEPLDGDSKSATHQLRSVPEDAVSGGSLLFRPPIDSVVAEKDGSYRQIYLPAKKSTQLARLSAVVARKGAGGGIQSPQASGDGRKLAYIKPIKEGVSVLMVFNGENQTTKTIDLGEAFINHFEWSPKGKQLLVERYEGASGGPWSTLFIIDLETNQRHSVDEITSDTAQWSPSGAWLSYQTMPGVRALRKNNRIGSGDIGVWATDIGVVKANGTGKTYLTTGAVFACLPRWITVTTPQ